MRLSRWLAPVLWAGVIEVLTSWPNPPVVAAPPGTDKVVHHALYAVLAFLSMRAGWPQSGSRLPWKLAVAVLVGVAAFGALDEWHQQFIPSRAMELGDWLADATGVIVGTVAYGLGTGVVKTRRERTT